MARPTLEELLACDFHQVRHLCVTSRRRLAACPRTDPAVLDALGSDPDDTVREAYARNRSVPESAMQATIFYFDDLAVRQGLARRRSLSRHMLCWLSRDAVPAIRIRVARRRGLPRDILEALWTDPDPGVRFHASSCHRLDATQLAWYARHPNPARRQVAAYAPTLDPALQLLLARDPAWQVRRCVPLARRSNQPLEVAMALALAPELAADEPVAQCLAAQIAAFAWTQSTTSIPRAALVDFLRSPAPAIREAGRRLALAAHRARTGAAAAATGDAAA